VQHPFSLRVQRTIGFKTTPLNTVRLSFNAAANLSLVFNALFEKCRSATMVFVFRGILEMHPHLESTEAIYPKMHPFHQLSSSPLFAGQNQP